MEMSLRIRVIKWTHIQNYQIQILGHAGDEARILKSMGIGEKCPDCVRIPFPRFGRSIA